MLPKKLFWKFVLILFLVNTILIPISNWTSTPLLNCIWIVALGISEGNALLVVFLLSINAFILLYYYVWPFGRHSSNQSLAHNDYGTTMPKIRCRRARPWLFKFSASLLSISFLFLYLIKQSQHLPKLLQGFLKVIPK